jgi:hypothetical protein
MRLVREVVIAGPMRGREVRGRRRFEIGIV